MTLEELKALIDGVELRNFPYEVRIKTDVRDFWAPGQFEFDDFVAHLSSGRVTQRPRALEIRFEQIVPDRDTGKRDAFTMIYSIHEKSIEDFPGDENDAIDVFVRQKLYEMVTHEVCEAIHHKGRRVFDPHRPEGLGLHPAHSRTGRRTNILEEKRLIVYHCNRNGIDGCHALQLIGMKRLEQGEGNSPAIMLRLRQKTTELLDELVERLPAHPIAGAQPRSAVLRAVIDAGIEVVAKREGVKLSKARRSKTSGSKASDGIDRRSRARAEKRAAARLAAGCTCGPSHVRSCKLYSRHSSAA